MVALMKPRDLHEEPQAFEAVPEAQHEGPEWRK